MNANRSSRAGVPETAIVETLALRINDKMLIFQDQKNLLRIENKQI